MLLWTAAALPAAAASLQTVAYVQASDSAALVRPGLVKLGRAEKEWETLQVCPLSLLSRPASLDVICPCVAKAWDEAKIRLAPLPPNTHRGVNVKKSEPRRADAAAQFLLSALLQREDQIALRPRLLLLVQDDLPQLELVELLVLLLLLQNEQGTHVEPRSQLAAYGALSPVLLNDLPLSIQLAQGSLRPNPECDAP
jgi:hypothetical protein